MIILTVILLMGWLLIITQELLVVFSVMVARPNTGKGSEKVSVLLVVRNEASNIEACLDSLLKQDHADMELLVMDDRSDDGTDQIIRSREGDPRLHAWYSQDEPPLGVNPKAYHLHILTARADGPIIAVTDGDCVYPTAWLSNMLAGMGGSQVVSGTTGIRDSRIEDLDWKLSIGRMALLTYWGFRTSAIGNNMLVRKNILLEVGGWSAVWSHLTEDYALNDLILKAGGRSTVMFDRRVLAMSEATAWNERFAQRLRWMKGVRELHWTVQVALFGQALILPMIVLAFFLDPVWAMTGFLVYLFVKILADGILLGRIGEKPWMILIPYQFYHLIWTAVFQLYFLFRKRVVWKGRSYR